MLYDELDCLVPHRDFSRRDFVRSSVSSGLAAAVLAAVAQTEIKTDSGGLRVGEVSIPVGRFKMPAYRAEPLNSANAPVVLVISEIFGVHEYIADVARRFAKQGSSPWRRSCSCARATRSPMARFPSSSPR